ncbi:MAG TPA: hypothetical protein VGP82_18375 [Ktedonobacterales bacterium]|jgi:hypothetical protein|nr:hypothetical protein [Ktedonobacterales bacterium]
MWFDDQEQRRTLAIVAIGPNASRFAARLCQVVAQLYGGDPPIYAIGLHDSLATRSVAERTLMRVRGMRRRSFSLTGQQRRQLRAHLHDGERASDEAALAIIHHELIRRVHQRRHPLENVLWIADGEYVSLCSDHIRRVRQVLDNTTLTAHCLLDHADEARAGVIEELKTWGDVDPKTGRQIAAATILSSPLSSLGTSALGRYQNDLLAWGLASLLFAPLQDKNNPPFSSIVKRLAGKGHVLAALAVETSAVPPPRPQARRWWQLFRRPRLSADDLAAHLAGRTRVVCDGAPVTTYGTLVYPEMAHVAAPARAYPASVSGHPSYYGDNAAYLPAEEQAVGRPIQISYIQPFQPGDLRFERLASDLGSWIGSAYHLPHPCLLHSRKKIDLPHIGDVMQGKALCQVSVLFGVDE